MSDQNGGKTEATEPESMSSDAVKSAPGAGSAQKGAPPVIEGEAQDITPPQDASAPASENSAASAELEADPDIGAETGADRAPPTGPAPEAGDSPRKGGALIPVAILIGAVALGGGGYFLWNANGEPPPAAKIAETTPPAPVKPTPSPLPEKTIPPAPAPEPSKAAEAPPPAPAPESRPAINGEAEKAVAEMTAKLAAAQAAVERLTQRLQTVESQLAASKDETRATLAARESGPGNSGEAAARVVVAQSLLTALRQGDDFSAQLAALQNSGVDPARLARLRAGLSAPTVNQLATAFAALAPKFAAAAAPPKPAEEAKQTQDTRGTLLGFISAEASKLVRIRPAGAPDKDAAAIQIEKIEKDLHAGDLAAALSARQELPAPALSLSAEWATAAQTRLDAEAAAKAELAEALQNLTKTKS